MCLENLWVFLISFRFGSLLPVTNEGCVQKGTNPSGKWSNSRRWDLTTSFDKKLIQLAISPAWQLRVWTSLSVLSWQPPPMPSLCWRAFPDDCIKYPVWLEVPCSSLTCGGGEQLIPYTFVGVCLETSITALWVFLYMKHLWLFALSLFVVFSWFAAAVFIFY